MRVIAGTRKGMKLIAPKNSKIRPTTDKTKQFIFDFIGSDIYKSNVLDLFAGTGSLGIEALSREAIAATFVERNRINCLTIQKNLQRAKFDLQAQVITDDVFRFLQWIQRKDSKYDFIFADPPYKSNLYVKLLHKIDAINILSETGYFILEHQSGIYLQKDLISLELIKFKASGATTVSFFKK